mgnify:CR=1 FL=1
MRVGYMKKEAEKEWKEVRERNVECLIIPAVIVRSGVHHNQHHHHGTVQRSIGHGRLY